LALRRAATSPRKLKFVVDGPPEVYGRDTPAENARNLVPAI
jgi:hypothetical protein